MIARDKEDVDAKYDRALLYAEINEPKKAVIGLEAILPKRPGEPEVSHQRPLQMSPHQSSCQAGQLHGLAVVLLQGRQSTFLPAVLLMPMPF